MVRNIKTISITQIFMVFIYIIIIFTQMFKITFLGEILLIISIFYLLVLFLKKKINSKYILRILILSAFLIIIGLVSNYLSDIDRPKKAIAIDLFTYLKTFLCFCASSLFFSRKNNTTNIKILSSLATISRILVIIGIFCYILNKPLHLNMSYGDFRYGIPTFQFIFGHPGMFSQYWIGVIIILTADLQLSTTFYKKIVLSLALIFWLTSLRARAFVMVFIYIVALIYLLSKNKINIDFSKKILKLWKIIPLVILAVFLARDQIFRYFLSGNDTARSLLLINGIKVMLSYFPLGSGFATYGTEIARTYYSPLYYKYAMNNYWALAVGGSELTDCYWPAVAAEIGVFGVIIVVLIIINIFKECTTKSKNQKYIFLASIIYIIYLLISSTATGIFFTDITASYLLFLGMIINIKFEDKEEKNEKNTFI